MKKYLPLLLVATLLGCTKENTDNTRKLLAKSWKMTAGRILTPLQGTALEGSSTDILNYRSCFTDKIQTFKPDGAFVHEKTATCIDDSDYTGIWTLSEDSRVVDVRYTGSGFANFRYNIIELTEEKLKVERAEIWAIGVAPGSIELLIQYAFEPR